MLVTFREHAALNLCIFHRSVTIGTGGRGAVGFSVRGAANVLFSIQYEHHTGLRYLKH
jgi:hypothetical protein